jgi:hypothetical protein
MPTFSDSVDAAVAWFGTLRILKLVGAIGWETIVLHGQYSLLPCQLHFASRRPPLEPSSPHMSSQLHSIACSVCLSFILLFMNSSLSQSVCLSLSVYHFAFHELLPVSVCLSVTLPFMTSPLSRCVCLSVCHFAFHELTHVSICVSAALPFMSSSLTQSVFLSLCVCLSVCLLVSRSVCPCVSALTVHMCMFASGDTYRSIRACRTIIYIYIYI